MEFRLLGKPELVVDGLSLGLGRRQQQVAFVALVLSAGRPVPVDTLITRVWGDDLPADPRAALATHLSRLRRILRRTPAGIEYRNGTYTFKCDLTDIDLHRFRAAVLQARLTRDDNPAHAADLYRQALAIWRGPALAGLSGAWVCGVAAELDRERLDADVARIDLLLRIGQQRAALEEVRLLAVEHPDDEPIAARLINALHATGRTADAIDAYHAFRRRLVERMGIEPSDGLQQSYLAMLRRPNLSAVTPAPVASTAAPSFGVEAAAQLPADVPAFTGRQGLLARLDALHYGHEPATIVAIDGPAGVGKTALAIHWAHRVRAAYVDGQLYVNLRGSAPVPPMRPIEALAMFLRALGVGKDRVPADLEEAAGLYRSQLANRRMLVLLDNASDAEHVRPLLPGSEECTVLVTSRDTLSGLVARDGAHRLTAGVLADHEARVLIGRVIGEARTTAEPTATDDIGRGCGFLPLALRIAAGHLAGNPSTRLASYAAALVDGDRLAALEVPGDHEAGVRASFALSYRGLCADAQRLYRLFGTAPCPDITVDGAAALLDADHQWTHDLLSTLAQGHLIIRSRSGRYAMHDLLRSYAVELASRHDTAIARDAALRRLYDYYLRTAYRAANVLYPHMVRLPADADDDVHASAFRDPETASSWLDAERTCMVGLIRHVSTHGPRQVAWRLADALRGYFWLQGHPIEWQAAAQAAVDAADRQGDPYGRAAGRLNLATMHWTHGRYQEATDLYVASGRIAREAGWWEADAAAIGSSAAIHRHLGRLDEAAAGMSRSLDIFVAHGSVGGEATTRGNLALVLSELGQLERAADQYAAALELHRKAGSRSGEGNSLGNLGLTWHMLGNLDEAATHLTNALTVHRETGNRTNEAVELSRLAAVHRDRGDLRLAHELAADAVNLAHDVGIWHFEAAALNTLATIERRAGAVTHALTCCTEALRLSRLSGDRYPETEAHIGLAAIHQELGDAATAQKDARCAVRLAKAMGYRMLEGRALCALGRADLSLGGVHEAARHSAQAAITLRETRHRPGLAEALRLHGHTLQQSGRQDDAHACWREALALFDDIGMPEGATLRALLADGR